MPAGRSLDGVTLRGQDATRHGLPLLGHETATALSATRWEEHGAANGQGPQAEPARSLAARVALA
jgi:hypothetical protein